jgi:hypothetical protein
MLRRIISQIENDILEAFVASIITSFADYVTQHPAKKYLHISHRENLKRHLINPCGRLL